MGYVPRFSVSPALLRSLETIAVYRERILTAAVHVPWVPVLQKEARERTTHASTAIEGNPLGLQEVAMLEAGKELLSADVRAKREALNYLEALRHLERHERKRTIGHDDILKLHAILMAGVMPADLAGRYRPYGVRVGTHVAPAATKVYALMNDLLQWIDTSSTAWPPVISSGIVHFAFEDIHPFADGNGRTGRLLALWELYRREFDTLHIFSVDEYFWEHRDRYYRELEAVRKRDGDLTAWLEFVGEAVAATLARLAKRAASLSVLSKGQSLVLRPRQERFLEVLRERRSLTPAEVWDLLKVSRQGALDLIKPLIKAGLVKRIGTKRSGRYVPV